MSDTYLSVRSGRGRKTPIIHSDHSSKPRPLSPRRRVSAVKMQFPVRLLDFLQDGIDVIAGFLNVGDGAGGVNGGGAGVVSAQCQFQIAFVLVN